MILNNSFSTVNSNIFWPTLYIILYHVTCLNTIVVLTVYILQACMYILLHTGLYLEYVCSYILYIYIYIYIYILYIHVGVMYISIYGTCLDKFKYMYVRQQGFVMHVACNYVTVLTLYM